MYFYELCKQVLREDFEFIRRDGGEEKEDRGTKEDKDEKWRRQMSKRYYDRLFKEFALADLSRYREKKIGLRWRTEREVICGKGHFICGALKCDEVNALESFEVNFGYVEKGMKKNALVKVRLCPDCAYKLAYTRRKKKKKKRKHKKKKRSASSSDEETSQTKRRRVGVDDNAQ